MPPKIRSSASPAAKSRSSSSSRATSVTKTKRPSSSTPSLSPRKVQKVDVEEIVDMGSFDDGISFDEDALLEATLAAEKEEEQIKKMKSSSSSSQEAKSSSQAKSVPMNTSEKMEPNPIPSTPGNSNLTTKTLTHGDPSIEQDTMDPEWYARLKGEMQKTYFMELKAYLRGQSASGKEIYPPANMVYSWSRLCPLSNIKIVVVGQDPYHGPGQANGLAFSVRKGMSVPPSLLNMYKELGMEYGADFKKPPHGCLDGWAKQGVLLLNACLTVNRADANSHRNRGWEAFTQTILKLIANEASHGQKASIKTSKIANMFSKVDEGVKEAVKKEEKSKSNSQSSGSKGIVFLAWGSPAQKSLKDAGITEATPNVLILKTTHPSPLSAHRGFIGCNHFKKANEWLENESRYGKGGGIQWSNL